MDSYLTFPQADGVAGMIVPFVVSLHNDINTTLLTRGDQPVSAVVTIGHKRVARLQNIEQFAHERRLAGLFTTKGAACKVVEQSREQRRQRDTTQDRKPQTFFLRGTLWVLRLILRRVRRRNGKPVQ